MAALFFLPQLLTGLPEDGVGGDALEITVREWADGRQSAEVYLATGRRLQIRCERRGGMLGPGGCAYGDGNTVWRFELSHDKDNMGYMVAVGHPAHASSAVQQVAS